MFLLSLPSPFLLLITLNKLTKVEQQKAYCCHIAVSVNCCLWCVVIGF